VDPFELSYPYENTLTKIHLGICIAPTQPFRAALGAESRVCYPGNTADRQTHLSQSTANENGK
jgi:hypothetical protein